MITPKISIIIPSLNQGKYIEQTLLSILRQNYPNVEVLVIDGGSTDKTVDVIKKYEKEISYWVSEPDRGQAHAINKGLERTTGDIVNWINSDDYLEPGSLAAIGEFFTSNPDLNVLCGYTYCFFDESNNTSHTYRMGIKKNTTDTILYYAMNQPGTFYRTSIIKELQGVNESLRYVFDNELWFRFLCKYGIETVGISNKLLAHFRLHDSSKSVGEGFEKFWHEQNDIWIHLAKQLKFSDPLIKCMETLPHNNNYRSYNWQLNKIKKERVESFWYEKYVNTLYLSGEKREAKLALKKMLSNNMFKFNRVNISLLTKLLLTSSTS